MICGRLILSLILLSLFACEDEHSDLGQVQVEKLFGLESKLAENSGLIYFDGCYWTINDSGNEAVLYAINASNGKIDHEYFVKGASNIDWEDLTQDQDYIYIADVGNNHARRNEFMIYAVAKVDLQGGDSISARSIPFEYYVSQEEKSGINCEAIISYKDQLILYTKDWPQNRSTAFVLSKEFVFQQAIRKGSYSSMGLVTGADFNELEHALVLIGYANYSPYLEVFKTGPYFEQNTQTSQRHIFIDMTGYQTEGVCLRGGDVIFSCEESIVEPGVYSLQGFLQ